MLRLALIRENVMLACGGTHEELESRFAKWAECDIEQVPHARLGRADGRTLHGDGYFALWAESARPSIVAHEAVHVSMKILDQRGITLDEELIAYMVQYIVREYLDAFA